MTTLYLPSSHLLHSPVLLLSSPLLLSPLLYLSPLPSPLLGSMAQPELKEGQF